jgi:hypothetical protein
MAAVRRYLCPGCPAGARRSTARPFNWKFTAASITALLRRLSERERKPPAKPI